MIRWMLVAGALFVAAPTQAIAQDVGDAEEVAREGVERLMRALNLLMGSIPQFEAPEINEDGDIIVRRKRPSEDGAPDEAPAPEEVEETRTLVGEV
jgi:hypothetical protein